MKVFLSHGRSETALLYAKALANHVEGAGFDALLPRTQLADVDLQAELKRQLEKSDAYVFVVDPAATRSDYVKRQWQMAIEQSWEHPDKPMIPVLVGDAELPGFLTDRIAVRVDPGEPADRVASSIVAALRDGQGTASDRKPAEEQRVQRRERLSEIAVETEKLAPSGDDVRGSLAALEVQLAAQLARDSASPAVAELKIKLADALKAVGRAGEGVEHLEAALRILGKADTPDEERLVARVHANLGRMLAEENKLETARDHWREALERYKKLGDSIMEFSAHAALTDLSRKLGDEAGAKAHRTAAAELLRSKVARLPFVGGFLSRLLGGQEQDKAQ